MARAKYASLEPDRSPPVKPKSWSNSNPDKNKKKGWTQLSNERYRQELKEIREGRKRDGPKNSGKQCDHCVTGDHTLCWRVVCYCPCYSRVEHGKGWPNKA